MSSDSLGLKNLANGNRLHGMDALRAIAMLLGIVLHSIIPYRIIVQNNWPSDSSFHSFYFDVAYVWIHTFRMPLFFLVAGFFARFLYFKIGENRFLLHRAKRILLPFIVSLITIVPLSIFPFIYYFDNIIQDLNLSLIDLFKKSFFEWNGLIHLWFLYYLIIFYIITITFQRIKIHLPKSLISKATSLLSSFRFSKLINIIIIGMVLSLFSFLYKDIVIEVYTGLRINLEMFVGYGFFYFIGWILHMQSHELEFISKHTWTCLVAGSLLLIPILMTSKGNTDNTYFYVIIKLLAGVQVVLMVFGCLGFFMKYFNSENKRIRYISDSSYWFYLVHMCFIVSLQIGLMNSIVPGPLRWLVSLLITTLISMISYDVFVRYSIIGNILNGPRKRKQRPEFKRDRLLPNLGTGK